MDERVLAERSSPPTPPRWTACGAPRGFVKGWLEARDIEVVEHDYNGLPVLVAAVGPETGVPTVILHGHIDVVPAHPEQFTPRTEGDRLIGRGAYDMKGGLATMMCALRDAADQDGVRVVFTCVPDEESEDVEAHSIDWLVREHGITGDFAITGEPTNLHIGIQAKGVLALRVLVTGTAAHGSTPWVGDNAILKAHDAFRRIETLPFCRESLGPLRPASINLARISGGDAFNKVPDRCEMDVDIRFPAQPGPGARSSPRSARSRHGDRRCATWPPAVVRTHEPVRRAPARRGRAA
jgi:succinyl-diaminopimelate desuccinylase